MSAVVLHHQALRDLRVVEASYVAGRKVTACTIARLNPSAGDTELARLDETLQVLVGDALRRSMTVRRELGEVRTSSLPSARAARGQVAQAIDAQVSLYETLSANGDATREVEALGRRNTEAERSIARLRSVLMVGAGSGWSDRFNCANRGFVEAEQ